MCRRMKILINKLTHFFFFLNLCLSGNFVNNSLTVIENTWSSVSTSCLGPANQCKYCHNSPFLNTIIRPDVVVICHSSFFIQSWMSIINSDWKKYIYSFLKRKKRHHFCQRTQKLQRLQSRLIFASLSIWICAHEDLLLCLGTFAVVHAESGARCSPPHSQPPPSLRETQTGKLCVMSWSL